jgi:hypothetical protein
MGLVVGQALPPANPELRSGGPGVPGPYGVRHVPLVQNFTLGATAAPGSVLK